MSRNIRRTRSRSPAIEDRSDQVRDLKAALVDANIEIRVQGSHIEELRGAIHQLREEMRAPDKALDQQRPARPEAPLLGVERTRAVELESGHVEVLTAETRLLTEAAKLTDTFGRFRSCLDEVELRHGSYLPSRRRPRLTYLPSWRRPKLTVPAAAPPTGTQGSSGVPARQPQAEDANIRCFRGSVNGEDAKISVDWSPNDKQVFWAMELGNGPCLLWQGSSEECKIVFNGFFLWMRLGPSGSPYHWVMPHADVGEWMKDRFERDVLQPGEADLLTRYRRRP
ncbi:MAG: hypothetical protein Q9216_003129 [Gyalolechia sp. 2 TL-2023]